MVCTPPTQLSVVSCTATAFVPLVASTVEYQCVCLSIWTHWQLPEPRAAENRAAWLSFISIVACFACVSRTIWGVKWVDLAVLL